MVDVDKVHHMFWGELGYRVHLARFKIFNEIETSLHQRVTFDKAIAEVKGPVVKQILRNML